MFQSTHPHGVRRTAPSFYPDYIGFNPRTHTGCDACHRVPSRVRLRFQSTHPHGVRLLRGGNDPRSIGRFNPRTHTRCDTLKLTLQSARKCFNPRTHTGCDFHRKHLAFLRLGFNPRTHTVCDTLMGGIKFNQYKFQSTHPHGVRQCIADEFPMIGEFQSTHPHGVRHTKSIDITTVCKFQSTQS